MHYSNGRPAKLGDTVLHRPSYGAPVTGIVCEVNPAAPTCNARLATLPKGHFAHNVTLSDCVHVEDLMVRQYCQPRGMADVPLEAPAQG